MFGISAARIPSGRACHPLQPVYTLQTSVATRRTWSRVGSAEDEPKGDEEDSNRFDEETVARLQKAEEEAERLRREIASLRSNESKEQALSRAGRTFWSSAPFDSKDLKRETIFESDNQTGNWLSEADVEFIMGESGNGLSPEDQAIVNRRLIIGGVLTSLFLAFAVIPTEKFQIFKPKGNVANYLVPVLRSKDLLAECRPLIENAQWEDLRLVIDRIVNVPNKLGSNLKQSTAFLKEADLRRRGKGLTNAIMEYVQEMDYNIYFEDRTNIGKLRGGAEEARFVEFSSNALSAANKRLDQYLALFPQNEVDSARNLINQVYE